MPEWTREVDQLREEMRRGDDQLSTRIDKCVSSELYVSAQKGMGERVDDVKSDVTTMHADRRNEASQRERDRTQWKIAMVGAALMFVGEIGIEILRIASGHGP